MDDIESTVLGIVSKHVSDLNRDNIKTSYSSNEKYISVTITIIARNKMQLDAIYLDLTNHPEILYAL